MKRLCLIIACLFLFTQTALALPLLVGQKVVYRGTVTGLRISAVNGTAFIDNAGATIPTLADGNHIIEIYDSSNRMLKGFLKAAGTGETLDTNIFSSYDFTSGWTPVNATINGSNQFTVMENNGNIYKTGLTTVPALYKILFSSSQTQGVSSLGGAFNTIFMDVITYNTAVYSTIRFYNTLKDAVVTINSVSVQQVLTPSSSGATIVSTKGGTTYNFAYRNTSFTYNAANYYVIIKEAK
jgi:hypothetical protein